MQVRTRFAPSPTGHLHVGGARTAILNWLVARHHGGVFVVRVEDTDIDRNLAGAEAEILDDLRWLGLEWDEGPDVGGPRGPYRQSARFELYRARAEQLLRDGSAYHCTCPPQTEASGEDRRRCACADMRVGSDAPAGASVRFRVPDITEIRLDDEVRGTIVFPASSVEDFVLLRSDGRPTYNFAAAVDDAEMEITHVVRGADHLNNTPKQILLYGALDREPPRFAHIPLILGEDRQKLSKRHGATSVAEHRRLGYLPEALLNYLSLLSWSSTTGEEVLARDRLVAEVDMGRVGASDAVFDPAKLRWLSNRYIQAMDTPELARHLARFADLERLGLAADRIEAVADAIRERISILSEASEVLAAFTGPASDGERAAREAALRDPELQPVLAAVAQELERVTSWEEAEVDRAIRAAGAAVGAKGKALFRPVRLAWTGREHGPELPKIAAVMGRQAILASFRPGAP
jgi:nondiscriminating glutamyl-tRNA synthetase